MPVSSPSYGFQVLGDVFAHIATFHPELTALRHDLHAHPELGFEEVYTAAQVQQALKRCGVDEIHTGLGKTGVVAVIKGQRNNSGKMLGLRADMDALSVTEHSDFAWKSTQIGRMHGCGHDGHTAMLLGATRYLAETRNFDGTAVLIFQPGEEGYGGAKAMIEDGLFERFPVQSIFGMHNWPAMRSGTFGINSGPMMVAAHIITAVQSIVSRNVRPIDNAVISLCAMRAGELGAMSVIPDSATLVGTVRSFSPQVQALVERRLTEMCSAVAQGFGATATVHYERSYPATINTAAEARFAADVAQSLVGQEHVVRDLEPSMGAEDFSFMLQVKPGAYVRIGQGEVNGMGSCFLHNSRYDFNDAILPLGAALHASLVEQAMPLEAI